MNTARAATLALLAVAILPAAHAQTVFALDGGEGMSSFTKTAGGITLTVDNVTPNNDIFAVPDFVLFSTEWNFMTGFDLHFDADLQITEYTISDTSGDVTGATFSLLGPNGNSLNNPIDAVGTFPLNGTFFLHANEVGTLTTSFTSTNSYVIMPSITTVPEPGTWALYAGLAAGTFVMAFRKRRLTQAA